MSTAHVIEHFYRTRGEGAALPVERLISVSAATKALNLPELLQRRCPSVAVLLRGAVDLTTFRPILSMPIEPIRSFGMCCGFYYFAVRRVGKCASACLGHYPQRCPLRRRRSNDRRSSRLDIR